MTQLLFREKQQKMSAGYPLFWGFRIQGFSRTFPKTFLWQLHRFW